MALKLVDMAMTKADMEEERSGCVNPSGQPDPYPWGLAISLESRELKKLGIKDLPQVGGEVHFVAVAKVTSVNQSASEDREESRVGLQITMMQIALEESAADEKKEGKETPKSEAREMPSILKSYKG